MTARVATILPPHPALPSRESRFGYPQRWMVVLVFAITLLAYLPSYSGSFLWDDDGHITKPELRSIVGLVRIWTEPAATQQYYPLLHSAFWLEHHLWGDHPLGYRLFNVLLHASAACLFAALLRRLAVPGAWLAAFVFALHPVCVESVAWITEQKNTLSLVFYLAAAIAYLRFDDTRRPASYILATGFFLASIFSKTVTVTLPAALLVVFAWRGGWTASRRQLAPLSLWLVLGLSAGVFTIWVERTLIGAQGEDFALSLAERGLLAGRVVWFYLGKLFWPADLIFIYPRWTVSSALVAQYAFPVALVALLTVLAAQLPRTRGLLAASLLFVGTLAPALGFINIYPFIFSFVADHFQYHACLAVIAITCAGLTTLSVRFPPFIVAIATLFLVTTLGLLTARHSKIFVSNLALFDATIRKNPASWMAYSNLGTVLNDKGEHATALHVLQKAHELRPDAQAENNLGYTLTKVGRAHEGLAHLERALFLQPAFAEAHNNRGIALVALRQNVEAVAAFQTALNLRPNYAVARFHLGLATAHAGGSEEAIAHFERALQLDPAYADAELHWGIGLLLLKRFPEAVPHFERAIALRPDVPEYPEMYGRALANVGRTEEAIARYRAALAIAPDFADAHFNLGLALQEVGEFRAAAEHQAEAQRLRGVRP